MKAIQILIMVFSLTGSVLLFAALPKFSLPQVFPILALILAAASMAVKSSRLKAVLLILAVILFALFLGFLTVLFSAAGVEISA